MSIKEDLEKKKKLKSLAKAAGAGGIKEAVKGWGTKVVLDELGKEAKGSLKSMSKPVGQKAKEIILKVKGTTTIRKNSSDLGNRDAQTERNVGKKYKDISPVMGKGSFKRTTPKDNWGNTGITQDEVDRKRKK